MLHPTQPAKKSYVETLLAKEQGVFVAVSDNIRTVPDQIAPWVPGGLFTLGTDGFGRSDTRARPGRLFRGGVGTPVIGPLYAPSPRLSSKTNAPIQVSTSSMTMTRCYLKP